MWPAKTDVRRSTERRNTHFSIVFSVNVLHNTMERNAQWLTMARSLIGLKFQTSKATWIGIIKKFHTLFVRRHWNTVLFGFRFAASVFAAQMQLPNRYRNIGTNKSTMNWVHSFNRWFRNCEWFEEAISAVSSFDCRNLLIAACSSDPPLPFGIWHMTDHTNCCCFCENVDCKLLSNRVRFVVIVALHNVHFQFPLIN